LPELQSTGREASPRSGSKLLSAASACDLRYTLCALVLGWIGYLAAYQGSLFLWGRGWEPLLVLLAAAGAWCILEALQGFGPFSLRDWPVWLLPVALVGWFLAPDAGRLATKAWFHFTLLALAMFYLGKCLARERSDRNWVSALLLFVAGGVALYAVIEYYAGFNPLYEFFWTHRPVYRMYRISGRPFATQFNMVPLASLMLAAIPFGLVRRNHTIRERSLIAGVVVLLTICLLLTRSRGPFLGLILMALLLVLVRRRYAMLAAGLALSAGLVLAADHLPGEWSRFGYRRLIAEHGGAISEYRLTRVRMALAMARERPLTGQGLLQFREQFEAFHPLGKEAGRTFRTADNMYLTLLVETGLVGLSAFVLFALWLLVPALVALWRGGPEAARGPPAAALLAFVGLLVGHAHYNLLYHTGPAMLFFLIAGFLAGLLQAGAFSAARHPEAGSTQAHTSSAAIR
jgi:putative inorganic carbon (HCO3(-)) transporter